ncbi:hypothetical protein M4D54_01935 [Brachybacterium sp. p3-SID1565]|uniref:CHAT domain-containing protein n=1 Tax=Brachybacterium epidermidis TaxID=2781983 RepID=A0ABR9W2U6_9MICO|nr:MULTISPECIES: DUF6642 family protein [Brachybacterium]MBE9404275.1 hypothetical protein [Brachybacterium epidermidis]MCT1384401.1 hypothetical protein [Brachybacterium sp. p3-SID1565]
MREDLPGIFCLEGEWDSDLTRRLSVRPVLELLEQLEVAQWIHRDVVTRPEFEYYLEKWTSDEYADFPVLWLAMHGKKAEISLSGDENGGLTLDELEDVLAGACSGKVIYFASCSTLKADEKRLQKFANRTRARAVIGYRKDVRWSDAAAFEVILLQELITKVKSSGIFRRLEVDHPVLAKRLGLVVATKTKVHQTALRTSKASS